jgi:WD40 repeat protein
VRRCLDFSPNGKTLLVGTGVDLQLYDVGTLQEVVAWEGHRSAVERIAFSADGRRLVTGSVHLNYMNPQEVATWDSQSWKRLHLASASNPQWPKIGIASFDRTVYVGKNGEDQANLPVRGQRRPTLSGQERHVRACEEQEAVAQTEDA